MAHIPDQLLKINTNIQEAESILSDLKKRTKTENVAEQIEHFESMLNKLNNLKDSYLQLSAQFEASSGIKKSLIGVASVLQGNNQGVSNYDSVNGVSSNASGAVFNIRNAFSSVDQLEQLKQERDRLKQELHDQQSIDYGNTLTNSLEVDVTSNARSFSSANTFTDLVSDLHNFTGLDLSFYISILDHHIDIGSKMVDMVDGLTLSDNLEQGIRLLKEVIQRLMELRERFQSVQNTQENIENQRGVDDDVLQREMETFNSISEDLKVNFATGVKCFKSAMDIIQSYLDPGSVQVTFPNVVLHNGLETALKVDESRAAVSGEGFPPFNDGDTLTNGSTILAGDEATGVHSKNNNNNSESASEDNNNRSNEEEDDRDEEDDNNDGGDEDSDDSCREKDQDELMEIGDGTGVSDPLNEDNEEAMHHLRLQTEFEQKEILRLLEEKRIMQKKLVDLKRAKEIAKNQALTLAQRGNVFDDFPHFLRSGQCSNDLDDNDDNEALSVSQRPNSLDLVNDMGSLLKMLSEMKTEIPCDDSYPSSPSRKALGYTQKSTSNEPNKTPMRLPFSGNPYSTQASILLPELNEKAEVLKQKQSQIKKLQEMLDQIKNDSLNLNESIINDSNDDYHSDHNNEREGCNNGRPGKGRDSVTFQEPVATFIANEELYENMREVRMRREELRDRSARNSNSDPRSPSGRVMDSGNAPGAPPDAPTRMPVTSHETASQDRTTAATWGSSSAGGDDYEDQNGGSGAHNQLNRENLRIRSEGNRVSPLSAVTSTVTDERSRVAPIGQSSTFRSKIRDSTYLKNVIDNGPVTNDLGNLKGQIDGIASLCRNMALEQNRLARDIADLKQGSSSSPRLMGGNNNGPDLVCGGAGMGGVGQGGGLGLGIGQGGGLGLGQGGGLGLGTGMDGGHRGSSSAHNNMEASWEEASIASSTALMQQHHQLQQRQWYYPPLAGCYQNVMHQQSMLLQNHAMFMKLQMSLMASQLEQQRLYNLALQQHTHSASAAGLYGPPQLMPSGNWPVRGITPPYYPPPGPLSLAADSFQAPPNFADLDCGLYNLLYQSESRGDCPPSITTTATNQHQSPQAPNNNITGGGGSIGASNPWKNSFPTSRNTHRN